MDANEVDDRDGLSNELTDFTRPGNPDLFDFDEDALCAFCGDLDCEGECRVGDDPDILDYDEDDIFYDDEFDDLFDDDDFDDDFDDWD